MSKDDSTVIEKSVFGAESPHPWLHLFLIISFFHFCVPLCFFYISCADVGFHLRTGELVWKTGKILSINTFSYTMPEHPWLLHQWLPATIYYILSVRDVWWYHYSNYIQSNTRDVYFSSHIP